jgi:hypothetical protein
VLPTLIFGQVFDIFVLSILLFSVIDFFHYQPVGWHSVMEVTEGFSNNGARKSSHFASAGAQAHPPSQRSCSSNKRALVETVMAVVGYIQLLSYLFLAVYNR